MCELLAMSSGVPATVNLALGVLARHGGGDGPDKDGWGIAYYEGGDVRLIKDAAPAFASPWIGFAEQLRREGPANFLYADGDAVFVHGDRRKKHAEARPEWPGLHFLVQHSSEGRPFPGAGGIKVEDVDHPVLLVASVPLTDEGWT